MKCNLLLFFALILAGLCHAEDEELVGRIDSGKPRIVAHAVVNGEQSRLLVCTGDWATFNFYPGAADRLGVFADKSIKHAFIESHGRLPTEKVDLEYVGGTFRKRLTVSKTSARVRSLEQRIGLDGAVGWGFLKRIAFRTEWDDWRVARVRDIPVHVSKWDTWKAEGSEPGFLGFRYEVPLNNGEAVATGIKTESPGYASIDGRLWERVIEGSRNAPRTIQLSIIPERGEVSVAEVVWLKQLRLGSTVIHGVPVCRVPGLRKSYGVDVLIGLRLLSRLDACIVGPRGVMHVRARDRYAWPVDYNRLGAVFIPEDAIVTVTGGKAHVLMGSPAWRAGLRDGDAYVGQERIGESVEEPGGTQPMYLSAPAGTKYRLTVKRGDKEITLVVETEEIFPDAKKYDPLPRSPKEKKEQPSEAK